MDSRENSGSKGLLRRDFVVDVAEGVGRKEEKRVTGKGERVGE